MKGLLSVRPASTYEFCWFKDALQLFDEMLQLKIQDANYRHMRFCDGHHLKMKFIKLICCFLGTSRIRMDNG
ncbi:hypothetical protein HanIR_Chr01g0024971 [Helianthus annuus]|nr:hypothetical protein HanIR_Chr01g0024971 [Helianthus annuus]